MSYDLFFKNENDIAKQRHFVNDDFDNTNDIKRNV